MKTKLIVCAGIILFTAIIIILAIPSSDEPELGIVGLASIPKTPEPTPEPPTPMPIPATPEPTEPPPEEEDEPRSIVFYKGEFELPIIGATGWAAAQLQLHKTHSVSPTALEFQALDPGQVFIIMDTYNEWWDVQLPNGMTGWVNSYGCMINLPDIIPSIIYRITNASSSVLRSAGYEIPNITDQQLYSARAFNLRLDRYEYLVPIQYIAAHGVNRVQQAALEQGNSIIMYEAFRPRETQRAIVSNLQALMNENEHVHSAITTPPWSIGWFISTGISNHQRGAAVDVSLARICDYEIRFAGDYAYKHINQYVEYEMPTPMHELSPAAATLTRPGGAVADTMTEGALKMQEYFSNEGFTLLASEWWHFNYPAAITNGDAFGMVGEFFTEPAD